MDNIGNLQLINIKYGPLTTIVFEFIDSIQIAPDLDENTWIGGTVDSYFIRIFNKNQGKLTALYENKGYTLKTVPFGSFFYLFFILIFWICYWIVIKSYKRLARTKT